MVFVKKQPVNQIFFLGNIVQENVFYDILERKNAYLGFKNKKFKTRKIDILPKGLTNGLGPKNGHFSTLFFQAIQARKMSFTISQNEKMTFQAIKTTSSKSRKIDIFPKGLTHGFGQKMAIFSTFFFQAIQSRKSSFTLFQNKKKPFLGYKNKKFKKAKN